MTPVQRAVLALRMWPRVAMAGPDDCWEWTGATTSAGYGHIRVPGEERNVLVHRAAYELCIGPIGANLVVDHHCENTLCCNPTHLEAVPQAVNLARAAGKRTHCRYGHELDGTRRDKGRDGAVVYHRFCRTCHNKRRRDGRSSASRGTVPA